MRQTSPKINTAIAEELSGTNEKPVRTAEMSELVRRGLLECKKITKKHGTSFYFATQFFPDDVQQGIYAIYAFARIPDEIVDNHDNQDREQALEKLAAWRRDWLLASREGTSDDPVMAAIVWIFRKYGISVETGEAFLKSMFMDKEKHTYDTYQELEEYMYGSAAVIGLMVTRVVGFHTEGAFPYAEKLGYAFQLTNFLRDIREDSEDLGRIYMPLDELKASGLSHEDIRSRVYDNRFVSFMQAQIERNREVYREALPGIRLLKWRGRLAVKISYVLYKGILDEIERVNYDVYKGRVRTNLATKLKLTFKVMFGIYE